MSRRIKIGIVCAVTPLLFSYGCAGHFSNHSRSYFVGRDKVTLTPSTLYRNPPETVLNVEADNGSTIRYTYNPIDTSLTKLSINGRNQTDSRILEQGETGLRYYLRGGSEEDISKAVNPEETSFATKFGRFVRDLFK